MHHKASSRPIPQKSLRARWLVPLSVICGLVMLLSVQTAATVFASGTITGTVFEDFNEDGLFNTTSNTGVARDLHLAGVTVTAYDSAGTVRGTTTTVRCTAATTPSPFCTGTDTGPNYSLSATGTGPYRVEFTWDNTTGALLDFQPSSHSTDSVGSGTTNDAGSTIRILPDGSSTNVNLALNRACDYCQNNPKILSVRFENGIGIGGTNATNASIISMPYNPTTFTQDAQIQETGSVWGITYNGLTQQAFASAFLKRHTGLGPRGLDGVYVLDYADGTGSIIGGFDLQGVTASNGGTIDLGSVTRTGGSDYTLPTNAGTANIDLDAFAKVGTVGFGNIDFGNDGKSLWMVNLNDRTLVVVDTSQVTISGTNPNNAPTAAVNHYNIVAGGPSSVTITGAPSCTNGTLRPFGLKIRETRGFLGVVCDAATSATRQNPPELIGYVLSFDVSNPTSFTQELSIPFTYNREPYYQMIAGTNAVAGTWQRWMNTWTDADINTPASVGCCASFRSAPAPILSDIAFMPDGSLILGVMDRFAAQSGWSNNRAVSGDAATLRQYGSAGDILLAKYNGPGSYTLESGENDPANADPGYRTDDSPGNQGEFFYGDLFRGFDANHFETMLGGVGLMSGSPEVVISVFDPNQFNAQGVASLSTGTGARSTSFTVTSGTGIQAFGKASGMGDVELLCDLAPIELGNRVWNDTDNDGIQDPDETPLAGITLQLWVDTDGDTVVDTQVGSVVTDANGEYYFGGVSNANMFTNPTAKSFSVRVNQSTDDAEQTVSSGTVVTNGTPFDIPRVTAGSQLDGLRFQNVNIPAGATITNATIQFTASANSTTTTVNALIRGEAADSAATFAASSNNISSRTTTSANVAWNSIGSWTSGATTNATTPNLSSVVQEIVDRAGWINGNSMAFVISDNASTAGIAGRQARSFDTASTGPTSAALLSVSYQAPYTVAPGTAYQIRLDPAAGSNTALLTGKTLTTQNAAQPANGNASAGNNNAILDVADSDAGLSGSFYVINLTTGNAGSNNHSLDIGFFPTAAPSTALGSIGNRVWFDEDSNGYQDKGEDGIPNVTVQLKDSSGTVIATQITDSNGGYLFTDLPADTYYVQVLGSTIPTGMTQTTTYPNNGADFFNQNQSGTGYQIVLGAGQKNLSADFGYNQNPTGDVNTGGTTNTVAALGDRVWIDTNGNGRQDDAEIGVSGVTVTLTNPGPNGLFGDGDDSTSTTTTDDNGYYMFDGLTPGAYQVSVTNSATASHNVLDTTNYTQTGDPDHFGTTGAVNDNQTTTAVVLGPGDVFLDADFGYQPGGTGGTPTLGSIGNFVWYDRDNDGNGPNVGLGANEGNGVEDDSTEFGLGGVTVALIQDLNGNGEWDAGEPIIATTHTSDGTEDVDGDGITDPVGFYRFRSLPITDGVGTDDYLVWVNDTNHVLKGLTATYDLDGDTLPAAGLATGFGISAATNLGTTGGSPYGTDDATDQDFGYTDENVPAATNAGMIGDRVWLDINNDGVQDSGEPGIPGVTVNLYDSTGTTLLATTTTGANGLYLFPDLPTSAGGITYVVRVDTTTLPGGLTQTYDNTGAQTDSESQATLTDATPVNINQDFGYVGPGTIGNLVWNDVNADGDQDAGEVGIEGVTLDLYYDANGNGDIDAGEVKIGTTTTDTSGGYLFSGLPVDDGGGNAQYVVVVTDTAGALTGYWHSLGANPNDTTDTAGAETTATSHNDPVPVTLTTSVVNNRNADFGYYLVPGAVGNYVWYDTNEDGIQDVGEVGINGVTVRLTITYPGADGNIGTGDDTVTTLVTTTSTEPGGVLNGWYSFGNLLQDEDYDGAATYGTEPTHLVTVTLPPGYISSPLGNGTPTTDSNDPTGTSAQPFKGQTNTLFANDSASISSYDFGIYIGTAVLGSIGNRVWIDEDSNGYQDRGEDGIPNVVVQLKNSGGTVIATRVTDQDGGYLFADLPAGTYYVQVLGSTIPTGMTQTTIYPNAGADFFNQDQSGTGYQIVLGTGETNLSADFGYNQNPTGQVNTGGPANTVAALGDRVWYDTNSNGRQDPGEVGIEGVTVTLIQPGVDGLFGTGDDDDSVTTTTDAKGYYMFDGLTPGAYQVEIRATGNTGAGEPLNSLTQTGDPDHWGTTGTNDNLTTAPIVLGPGDVFLNADFGYVGGPVGSIGNFVWYDRNADGVGPTVGGEPHGAAPGTDNTEFGIPGVTVALIRDLNGNGRWDAGEPIIATTHTSDGTEDVDGDGSVDYRGYYNFRGLPVTDGVGTDDYLVWVNDTNHVLNGLRPTYDFDGAAPASGLATGLGISSVLNLTTTSVIDQDFGYTDDEVLDTPINDGVLGDRVWLDLNSDGVQDVGEPGIPGVVVELYDSTFTTLLSTTTTGFDGYYLFPNLSTDDGGGSFTYGVRVVASTLPGVLIQTYDYDDGTGPFGTPHESTRTLTPGSPIQLDQDFGYVGTGTIGNFVWLDENANGVVDGAEAGSGIAGVTIDLYYDANGNGLIDADEIKIGTTTTDANGSYLFTGLSIDDGGGNAQYVVNVSDTAGVLKGYWHSLGNQADTSDNTSKASPHAVTLSTVTPDVLTVDFGYYVVPGAVGNYVWYDTDADGVQDGTEVGINGVTVTLEIRYPGQDGALNTADDTVTTLTTLTQTEPGGTRDGWYSFGNLLQDEDYNGVATYGTEPGHTITVTLPTGYSSSPTGAGTPTTDSNNPTGTGAQPFKGQTNVLFANDSAPISSYDFGIFRLSLTGTVFLDIFNGAANGNLDDPSETPNGDVESGLTVYLFQDADNNNVPDGAAIATTTTDATGNYAFNNLQPGRYIVSVVLPAGWRSTIDNYNNADTLTPQNGVDNNDNGIGGTYGQVFSHSFNLIAGSAAANNVVNNALATTSNDRLDFGINQAPTAIDLAYLTAQSPDDTSVVIAWETLNERLASGYNVQRQDTEGGEFVNVNSEFISSKTPGSDLGNTYEFTDTNVTAGAIYWYRLELVRSDSTTDYSEPVQVQVGGAACGGKPAMPKLLSPSKNGAVSGDKITLTWESSNCAVTYKVRIRQDHKKGPIILRKDGLTKTEVVRKDLLPGNVYVWRVIACNANGECTPTKWSKFEVK